MKLPKIEPMELVQQATPFDHADWLFEVKHDGFRSLAYIDSGTCRLESRNAYGYRRFGGLRGVLAGQFEVRNAIVDGELVVLDKTGRSLFYDLMANRGTVVFAAFDLLWLDGRDLRDLPLTERKEILRFRIATPSSRVLFVDHIETKGKALYQLACKRDLEGIVCKPAISPYRTVRGKTTWIKVKNPKYSQAEERGELFNPRRS